MTESDKDAINGQQPADHLFISYATEDGELAEWLTLRLTTEGYKAWCDRVKLLGGESYPRDIDKAIKTQTFRMLALISKNSLTKENPLKERTLGHNISRQRKVDFVIPLLVDETRSDELDWMDSDLTYIPFRDSWAQGLIQLVKKLKSINTPNPLPNGAKLVSDWVAQQSSLPETQERLWSNLFEIKAMPSTLYKMTVPDGFKLPAKSWIHHKQSSGVYWGFELPDSSVNSIQVDWDDNRRNVHGIAPVDVAAMLVKEHVRKLCLQKGARETLDRDLYLYQEATADGWLRFSDYRGKQSHLLAWGERTFRSADGTRNRCRYYLSPVFRPILRRYSKPVLELQIRLHLTDLDGKAFAPRTINSRRKRIAKHWWNYEWISRVFAVGQWAFGEQPISNLATECSYEIGVSGTPIFVTAPFGIDESVLKTPDIDEETQEIDESDLEEEDESETRNE